MAKRYIDADKLKDTIKYYHSHTDVKSTSAEHYAYGVALKEIDNTPTEDVVSVVRCRDCKHYDGDFCNNDQWWNDDSYITVDDDNFCSYGERKDQNG